MNPNIPKKPISSKELEALRHIRNRVVHGQEPPSVRELQQLLGFGSPNAAAYVLARLMQRRFLQRRKDGRLQLLEVLPDKPDLEHTIRVPLVGSAPCGAPLLAEQNIEAMIPISDRLARPPYKYFILRAKGDSMNLAGIQDGDLVLVRQQPSADNGDRIVALIDDEATIKEFRRTSDAVALMPRSENKQHTPIYLTTEFQIQGVVSATLPNWKEG